MSRNYRMTVVILKNMCYNVIKYQIVLSKVLTLIIFLQPMGLYKTKSKEVRLWQVWNLKN